ncbi:alpha/beta hydrolase [Caballeronia sp. LZ029]|uniref:alpha/beta fold hydrolase n=1 Tax=Caballeronia sp. LZ029 TaxID=3038564 RepID=UPI00285A44C5|nr:alpha/beta hydrolase [Caballeronia sp. LZ029]MDR5744916.1 alpha/beta hydrolase [Caballeronia sp. LZ029]
MVKAGTFRGSRIGLFYEEFGESEELASLDLPVLIIQGSDDPIFPPAHGARARSRVLRCDRSGESKWTDA